MDKAFLLKWLEGMREVNRITDAEAAGRTFEQRWMDRIQVQAMLSLMPNRPIEDVDEPRRRWTLLKDKWLERRA